jgi:hypothetical protein
MAKIRIAGIISALEGLHNENTKALNSQYDPFLIADEDFSSLVESYCISNVGLKNAIEWLKVEEKWRAEEEDERLNIHKELLEVANEILLEVGHVGNITDPKLLDKLEKAVAKAEGRE